MGMFDEVWDTIRFSTSKRADVRRQFTDLREMIEAIFLEELEGKR